MAKLSFRFGAMGSSKTAQALIIKHNFEEKGKNVILLKPALEDRDGKNIIKSRIGIKAECEYVEYFLEKRVDNDKTYDCIIIEEAQFLTSKQVEKFANIVDYSDIPVICFGLKTNFKGKLFEGSKRLLELADEIEEIVTICWCGKKARFNARVCNEQVVKRGEEIQIGGNESYVSLCRKHYNLGQLERDY